jgi:hypothetical protein
MEAAPRQPHGIRPAAEEPLRKPNFFIVRQARQVLDTRNATRGISEGREKITLL